MENNLQTTRGQVSTDLNNKEVEIAFAVWNVNLCVAYPLSDIQIEQWAKTIHRLSPETTLEMLSQIIDSFITCDKEWDTRIGIQNIFKVLKSKKGQTINF